MSGLYGTIRGAYIDPQKDVEMFYFYRPNRSTTDEDFSKFKTLSVSNLVRSHADVGGGIEDVLPGMFNLRLPLDIFNDKGIYTVYIRPKEKMVHLQDVSVLADYPSIRGVVINKGDVDGVVEESVLGVVGQGTHHIHRRNLKHHVHTALKVKAKADLAALALTVCVAQIDLLGSHRVKVMGLTGVAQRVQEHLLVAAVGSA